ncbi:collagenase [Sporosarcina luteola]|uniref:collagenase n=1 Tax=Sporosarcina luteola TaxID=582850 RepID=UPI00203F7E64|nr:collagenase [Sporosarcina luteola]MCM3744310.1 collagenase [Sporosarcina luteola]
MSKKTFFILVLLIVVLFVIKVGVDKYKENIPQLLSSFIDLEKIDEDRKEELLEGYNHISFEHLTIHYLESDKELLLATKNALNHGIKLNQKIIGSYNKPYDVVIFKNNHEIESFSGLEYAIGFNSPSMNMFGVLPENREGLIKNVGPTVWLFNKNVMHEYTHYVFTQKLSELEINYSDIPLWFSEGIAEYIGMNGMEAPNTLSKIVPLNELTTHEQWNNYRTDPLYDIYLQSNLAIQFLINEYGSDVINKILFQTQMKGDFEVGFQSVTGLDVSNLSAAILN